MSFQNKTVLITGGSAGIGRATALAFARAGANLCVNGTSARGEALIPLLEAAGARAIYVRGDVADCNFCDFLVDSTVKRFGGLDVVVNCAGIVPQGTVLDLDEASYERAFGVNVRGLLFVSRAAITQMLPQKSGVIVNVASVAGLIGAKNRALYSATKGAVISFTRALAADFAADGIRANCVCPGMVESPSLAGRIAATPDPAATRSAFEKSIPIGRLGRAEEIARAILFSASDENAFMTGSIVTLDGGASL